MRDVEVVAVSEREREAAEEAREARLGPGVTHALSCERALLAVREGRAKGGQRPLRRLRVERFEQEHVYRAAVRALACHHDIDRKIDLGGSLALNVDTQSGCRLASFARGRKLERDPVARGFPEHSYRCPNRRDLGGLQDTRVSKTEHQILPLDATGLARRNALRDEHLHATHARERPVERERESPHTRECFPHNDAYWLLS